MGDKYHVLHRHLSRLSRLSRRDDLELGVAVTSIHRAAEKMCSRKPKDQKDLWTCLKIVFTRVKLASG